MPELGSVGLDAAKNLRASARCAPSTRSGQPLEPFTNTKPTSAVIPRNSAEIAKALLEGNNPRRIIILAVKESELNAKGEIVDPGHTAENLFRQQRSADSFGRTE